jgi:hypothetical protein
MGMGEGTHNSFKLASGLAARDEQVVARSAENDYQDADDGLMVLCLCGEGEELVHCGFRQEVHRVVGCVGCVCVCVCVSVELWWGCSA